MKQTLLLPSPVVRRFRRRSGIGLSGEARDTLVLVSVVARATCRLVPQSRMLDAPADGLSMDATLDIAAQYELVITHTSTPSFPTDALFAEHLNKRKPSVLIGMVGAKVAVDPHGSLTASDAIDFVCREEFDYTCKEVAEGKPFGSIRGLSWRNADGSIEHNEARPILEKTWTNCRSSRRSLNATSTSATTLSAI